MIGLLTKCITRIVAKIDAKQIKIDLLLLKFHNYLTEFGNNPNFSITIDSAKAYAGGISVSDIRANIDNCDNFTVDSDVGIPKDYEAIISTNTKQNIFNPYSPYFPPFRF